MPIKPALQRVLKAILHTEERNENSEEATEKKIHKTTITKTQIGTKYKSSKTKKIAINTFLSKRTLNINSLIFLIKRHWLGLERWLNCREYLLFLDCLEVWRWLS